MNQRSATQADAEVGRRIRDHRISRAMPRAELSARVGVSQPQLYRYEAGLTRVAASRLIAIAAALGVSIEALTGGADGADLLLRAFNRIASPARRGALLALARSMSDTAFDIGPTEGSEADRLLRAFSRIARPERRRTLLALADSMAAAESHAGPIACAEVDLLLHAFSRIARPERRSALLALARSMADAELRVPM